MSPLLLTLAIGCAEGPYGAPFGSTIELPENQLLVFDMAYGTPSDGVGLLIVERLLVLGPDELPLNNIQVEVTSGWSEAYVVPALAVKMVDEYSEACAEDGSEECGAWFDNDTEQYVEFAGEYEDLGGLRPTYVSGATDERGVFNFYVFIDSVPIDDEGEIIEIPLYASIGVDTDTWSYDFE